MWAWDIMTIPFASCAHGTTVHQNHLWNILTQIALTYPRRQCFILSTVGLCLYVHWKPSWCFWGTAGVERYCTLHTLRTQANFKQQTNISLSNNLIYSVAAWNTKLKRMLKPSASSASLDSNRDFGTNRLCDRVLQLPYTQT